MTQYISTRGKAPAIDFSALALSGTAPDKGLYVPQSRFRLGRQFWQHLVGKSYVEVAYATLHLFAEGFDSGTLERITSETYTAENFKFCRADEDPNDIVPIRNLWGDTYLAGTSNGPTLAFKDMAMQLLAPIVAHLLDGERYTIVGATSGDTGSAAIEAFRRYANINTFMMSGGAMSPFQQWQMYTCLARNVHNLRLENFDLTQKLLKELFGDTDFVKEFNVGSVNSVNLVRILAQVVYAFWTYLQVLDTVGEKVDFVVPSGNFGNAFSVFYAKQLGLPVRRIIIATNENDVLHRFVQTGIYQKASKVTPTLSPSMDIQVASNLERAIYYVLDGDSERVEWLYAPFGETGLIDLSGELERFRAAGFASETATMAQCRLVMKQVYQKTDLLIDPHTAVAIYAASHQAEAGVKTIVYETAQAVKFADVVEEATGVRPVLPKEFVGLADAEMRVETIEPSVEVLKRIIRENQ